MKPMGAASLANALTRNSSLRSLNLSGNRLGGDGVQVLFAAFGAERGLNNTLRVLGLAENDLGADRDTVNTVCQSIVKNKTLHSIDLHGNALGDEGAVALAPVVGGTAVLRVLDIGDAGIGPIGVTALMGAVKSNTSLQVLGLRNNQVGVEGAARLADELKRDRFSELDFCELNIYTS